MSMLLQRGGFPYDLLQRLRGDKAGRWNETFGDQLPDLCQRVVEELGEVGALREDSHEESVEEDEFEEALQDIFEDSILHELEPRDVRLNRLQAVESKCRKARVALGLPPTDLRL